ncbi:MAG: hypothetical protein AMJ54_05050 [Deltaproteobacteria bacterium SG8_13]|nr:MAG: hypothetical protein AMJ54_05050 [Deltaproteobacteria bacterium SG8_13]
MSNHRSKTGQGATEERVQTALRLIGPYRGGMIRPDEGRRCNPFLPNASPEPGENQIDQPRGAQPA